MRWRISLFIFTLALLGCSQEENESHSVLKNSYLIEADDLKEMIDRPNIKLIDFRSPEAYAKAHIAQAVNIGRSDLEDSSFDYKGMMAKKDQMETLLGNLGIGHNDTLVVYDDNGLCNASRLWWILQNYGFDKVRLLNGGLPAWELVGGMATSQLPHIEKVKFSLPQNSSMKFYFSKEDVLAQLGTKAVVVDTRTNDEFSGKRQKKGAVKGGRIPGSIHIDWAKAINYNGDKRMKSQEDLQQIYGTLRSSDDEPIILYCHTGMRSAHTTFVLTQLLGYKNIKNYDGSWTEWSRFDELPFEQDSLTSLY